MEKYCFEQLAAGHISRNLAVIYEQFINEDSVDEVVAEQLPKIMFAHEITCSNHNIAGVYVNHRELDGEEFVRFISGRAVVNIYTGNVRLFLADRLENRYCGSVDYMDDKLLHLDHLAEKCYEINRNDKGLLLYLYNSADAFKRSENDRLELYKNVWDIEQLEGRQRRKIFNYILKFYFNNFEGDKLDTTLQQLDWERIDPADFEQLIEYLAVRHCYEKAMQGIEKFGYEKIDVSRLLQISSQTFAEKKDNMDEWLVKLAWHIFDGGKFDENTLKYLCRYFTGSLDEMIRIWKAAWGFEIPFDEIAEKILAQMLFTEEVNTDCYEVFYSYYERGTNKKLIRGFAKYISHRYLVNDMEIPDKMFEYFFREVRIGENISCLIAALKHLSEAKHMSAEEMEFARYNVNVLYEKGIVFPFFKNFAGKFELPVHIMDEFYVEYKGNPKNEVRINYSIMSDGVDSQEISEPMRNVYYGIFVKEFVLFKDELLQYSIVENGTKNETVIVDSEECSDTKENDAISGGRYRELNNMLEMIDRHDDGVVQQMREYARKKYTVEKLFELQ